MTAYLVNSFFACGKFMSDEHEGRKSETVPLIQFYDVVGTRKRQAYDEQLFAGILDSNPCLNHRFPSNDHKELGCVNKQIIEFVIFPRNNKVVYNLQ